MHTLSGGWPLLGWCWWWCFFSRRLRKRWTPLMVSRSQGYQVRSMQEGVVDSQRLRKRSIVVACGSDGVREVAPGG